MPHTRWVKDITQPQTFRGDARLGPTEAQKAYAFHKTMPGYGKTPLVTLPGLAKALRIGGLWVKDESKRFGQNSFKPLGASYAMAHYLGQKAGLSPEQATFEQIRQHAPPGLPFITCTDGNHGRGVAWAAKLFGQKAVILMPKGTKQARIDAVRALGAEVLVSAVGYDQTVDMARDMAQANGYPLMQDTAWPGYTKWPFFMMQGYLTMCHELERQCALESVTHVFLQAGVGSFAAAAASYLAKRLAQPPLIAVVEPQKPIAFSGPRKTGASPRYRRRWIPSWRGCAADNPTRWPGR